MIPIAVSAWASPEVFPAIVFPLVAVGIGIWSYRDAADRGIELAPLVGVVLGGLFLAGTVPGLVALAITSETAIQGFPTAIRIVPGLVALAGYLTFR